MPKILDELYECKLCGFAPTNQKGHYDRHMTSMKHRRLMKPELAKQLADLKMEQMELKSEIKYLAIEKTTEVKRLQIEKELELRQRQEEIKQQIKEQDTPERVVTSLDMIHSSKGMLKFQEKLINLFDELEDYADIYNGVFSFQDIFKRDFSALYEEDKVCIIDKGQTNLGYWINNAPCYQQFYLDDKMGNGLTSVLKCIPLYHSTLKKYASETGFKTDHFILTETEKKELEEWIKEEITILHS